MSNCTIDYAPGIALTTLVEGVGMWLVFFLWTAIQMCFDFELPYEVRIFFYATINGCLVVTGIALTVQGRGWDGSVPSNIMIASIVINIMSFVVLLIVAMLVCFTGSYGVFACLCPKSLNSQMQQLGMRETPEERMIREENARNNALKLQRLVSDM